MAKEPALTGPISLLQLSRRVLHTLDLCILASLFFHPG